jgi:hypothetical protein
MEPVYPTQIQDELSLNIQRSRSLHQLEVVFVVGQEDFLSGPSCVLFSSLAKFDLQRQA